MEAHRCAWHSDLGQAGADWVLSADEAGAPGGAALLRIIIGEGHAFFGDAVDVGGAIPHSAAAKMADVPYADVVSPQDEDVGLFRWHEASPLRASGGQ